MWPFQMSNRTEMKIEDPFDDEELKSINSSTDKEGIFLMGEEEKGDFDF